MASDTRPPIEPPRRLRRLTGSVLAHLARIRYRLLLVNLAVVVVPIIGISFARTFETEMLRSLEDGMIHQAQLLREALLADAGGLQLATRGPMLAQAARHTRTRIRLVDSSGQVVADSHAGGPPEGAELAAPRLFGESVRSYDSSPRTAPVVPPEVTGRREIEAALAGRYGAATRLWKSEQRVYLFSAVPIVHAGQVRGVVYATRSTEPVKFAMYRLRTWLLWILAAAVTATAVLSLFLAATISRPLTRLTRIAERIATGERGQRLALTRRDEIGQLARAFDIMARRLDERARGTAALAADISHEFKSPLTSIRGAAELLQDGAADDLPARARFLGNIVEDTDRLDRLVTRLLELSRFESDPTPTEYFDYEALVREVVDRRRMAISGAADALDISDRSGATIDIESAYRARVTLLAGRRSHIASLVGNLVDNAIQHAEPGTTITVQVSDGPRGRGIRTTVHNRGPVISAAAMSRIWDRFFTTRAKQGGTGLGLSIVAAIARAHGGTVSVTSTAEHGTAFSFDLPPAA